MNWEMLQLLLIKLFSKSSISHNFLSFHFLRWLTKNVTYLFIFKENLLTKTNIKFDKFCLLFSMCDLL